MKLPILSKRLWWVLSVLTAAVIISGVLVMYPKQCEKLAAVVTGDRIAAVLGSILGTFLGALLAFTFAKFTRNQIRNDENVAAGNLALFALVSMYNKTKQYQGEVIDLYRNRHDAWLNLPVTFQLDMGGLFLDPKSLAFIAQSYPAIFADVLLEEERFRLVAHMVTSHRSLCLEKMWPRLSEAGVPLGGSHALSEIEGILGPALVQQARVTSAGIIRNIDQNVLSLVSAFRALRKKLKELYPSRKFMDFTPA